MIRVGVIGAGANTRKRHIPGFQAIEDVEVVAVANRSKASAESVCSEFGIAHACWEADEIFNDPEIDAICIGTWPYRHAEFTCRALKAGKHVLTEARMAMNAEEAAVMIEAAKAASECVTMVVPAPFTLEYDSVIRDLVERKLGKLLLVDLVDASGAFADPEAKMTWRQDRALSGNNILTMGIYYETLSRWVGHARTVQASTQMAVPFRKNDEGEMVEVTVPDAVRVMGQLQRDDATYTLSFSGISGAREETGCWIHGTEGTIFIPFDGTVHFAFKGDEQPRPVRFTGEAGWRVEEEFIGAIRGNEPVRHTTFAEGLAYMRFTDAVHRSAATGQVQEV